MTKPAKVLALVYEHNKMRVTNNFSLKLILNNSFFTLQTLSAYKLDTYANVTLFSARLLGYA